MNKDDKKLWAMRFCQNNYIDRAEELIELMEKEILESFYHFVEENNEEYQRDYDTLIEKFIHENNNNED